MSVQPKSAPLAALVDVLARHRMLLFVLYVGVIGASAAVVYRLDFVGAPGMLDYVVPGRERPDLGDLTDRYPVSTIWYVAGLLLLQALFLFGGGRIPLGKKPAGISRTLIPVSLAAAAGVLVVLTLAAAVAEMFDRSNGEGSIRETALFDLSVLDPDSEFITWLVIVWVLWVVLALVMYRGQDQETVLRRLTNGLLAGSWIEFLVALPVDIAIRQRADSCICATGSWLALMFAIPIMVFAFGPALFLLYLREVELGRVEPRRAMRILLHKSRRRDALPQEERDE